MIVTLVVIVSNHCRMSCVEGTCLDRDRLDTFLEVGIFEDRNLEKREGKNKI